MQHFKKEGKRMDKKETEQKKEESKNKPKQEMKQQYIVAEYVKAAESLFSTKPECVMAAFQIAGLKTATEEQAKRIVKSFLEMEV